jgi:hypothetical protein
LCSAVFFKQEQQRQPSATVSSDRDLLLRLAGSPGCRRHGPPKSAEKSTSTGTETSWLISWKISSTAKGSESGGSGNLQLRQRPVLARYFAGMRFFWPQWLQARITGKKDFHRTNRRGASDACRPVLPTQAQGSRCESRGAAIGAAKI